MIRIMVIDGNRNFRRSLAELLRSSFSATVMLVPPREETILKEEESNSPHAIFIDMQTLRSACFGITRKIKNSHPDAVIIFMTSFDAREYREAARFCGADYFLAKNSSAPGDILRLIESIARRQGNPAQKGRAKSTKKRASDPHRSPFSWQV